MNGKTMDERVTNLEKLAETLAPLPDDVRGLKVRVGAVESQIVQLRTDLDDRTTAILQVIDSSSKATQRLVDEVLVAVREGDQETPREMRVLHEDLVNRISLLGGRPPASA